MGAWARRTLGWIALAAGYLYLCVGTLLWGTREIETRNGISYAWERAVLTEPLTTELAAIPQEAWVSPRPLVLSIKVYGWDEWWRIPLARGITPDYPQKTASPPSVVSDELTVRFTTADGIKVDLTPERVHVSGMNWDSPSAEQVLLSLSRPSTLRTSYPMMKPHVPVLFAALVLGCKGSGPKDVPIDPDAKLLPVSKATVKQPIEAIRGMSAKMLAWVVRQGGTENTMVSPFSLAEVLTMLYPGATGKGKAELEALLGPNPDMSAIRKSLSPLEKGGILNQANAAWIRPGAEINPAYLEALRKFSGPQVHQADFPEPALSEINDFANTQTHGRIPTILEHLDPQAILVLANAIAYKDRWALPFEAHKTNTQEFTLVDRVASVPFMHTDGDFAYLATPRLQAVTLAYKSGLSMTLWLPKKGVSLEVMFQEPRFGTLLSERRDGSLALPKWTGGADIDLKQLLPSVGVNAVFVPGNLDGLSPGALVGQAVQKSWIRTDEEGTEAAVVTDVAVEGAAFLEDFRFVADHPFAYTIHTPEGAILFCGVVRKP